MGITKILGCKDNGMQRYWDTKILGCKDIGMQRYWDEKILRCLNHSLQDLFLLYKRSLEQIGKILVNPPFGLTALINSSEKSLR